MIETTLWTIFVATVVSLIVTRMFGPRTPPEQVILTEAPEGQGHVEINTPRGRVTLIEDPEGYGRVELIAEPRDALPEGMVGFRFLTKQGNHRLGLGMFDNEGSLTFLDATGLSRLSIRIEETSPRIIFWQQRQPPGIGGTRRIVLGFKSDGSHALEFFHEDGTVRASLGVQSEGTAFLTLYDANGNVIWKAP